MRHTVEESTTWIQYRCEYCGEAITEARPGWMEFYSGTNGVYGMPSQYEVHTTLHHHDCGKDIHTSYAIRLPKALNCLDDKCSSSSTLADWTRHLSLKNWYNMVVMETLNSWEPVLNDTAEPPIRCESTDDDGDDRHVREPADQ